MLQPQLRLLTCLQQLVSRTRLSNNNSPVTSRAWSAEIAASKRAEKDTDFTLKCQSLQGLPFSGAHHPVQQLICTMGTGISAEVVWRCRSPITCWFPHFWGFPGLKGLEAISEVVTHLCQGSVCSADPHSPATSHLAAIKMPKGTIRLEKSQTTQAGCKRKIKFQVQSPRRATR